MLKKLVMICVLLLPLFASADPRRAETLRIVGYDDSGSPIYGTHPDVYGVACYFKKYPQTTFMCVKVKTYQEK